MPDPIAFPLRPEVRLFLAKNRRFFGFGPFKLLSSLEKSLSLRDACKKMNLSYSKGLRMIDNIESELGVKVVVKTRGGTLGGHTLLTVEGKALLDRYEAFSRECRQKVEEIFHKHFDVI